MYFTNVLKPHIIKKDEKSPNEIRRGSSVFYDDNIIVPRHNPNDIQSTNLSSTLDSNQNIKVTLRNFDTLPRNTSDIVSSTQTQLQPPPPPLRSPFTRLSINPINVAFQSINIDNTINAVTPQEIEEVPDVVLRHRTDPKELENKINKIKSASSITKFYDFELSKLDSLENDSANSERSAEQDSTVATTETSILTSTTVTTNSLPSQYCNANLVVTLKKSIKGFGFSLTSRQNPVDLTNPVYVSKVLENGPAIFDGRMKAGDRIIKINDEDVQNLSQKEIKDILLNFTADTSVKIGLYRPISDAISSILVVPNTSAKQKENALPTSVNTTTDDINNDHNLNSIEEQKQAKFAMCDCVHNHSLMSQEFSIYHFIISQKLVKADHLSPTVVDRIISDILPKPSEIKAEPPAIQLHHQNKLSPSQFQSKPVTDNKYSHATLGISVRKGFSQIYFDDYESVCQTLSETGCSSTTINHADKNSELSHKLCPNCHGLLFLKDGVFVTTVIQGGVACADGRVAVGDEIIAVQGVSLSDGELYIFPDNKVGIGDPYDSTKMSHMATIFRSRISSLETKKTDPLNLLKQLLCQAQSMSNTVSLVIVRKNLEKRSITNYSSSSFDVIYGHNVTVAADVHTQTTKDICKGEIINSNNRLRIYGKSADNSTERNLSTDLICLDSEHEVVDDESVVNQNIQSPDCEIKLTESDSLLSRAQIKFKIENIHFQKKNHLDPVIDKTLYSVKKSYYVLTSSSSFFQTSFQDALSQEPLNDSEFPASLHFSREDNSRQSFSLKRIHLNKSPPRMSRLSMFRDLETTNAQKSNIKNRFGSKRPKSEVILSRVEEESNSNSDVGEQTDVDERVKPLADRRVTLRRRSAIARNQARMSIL